MKLKSVATVLQWMIFVLVAAMAIHNTFVDPEITEMLLIAGLSLFLGTPYSLMFVVYTVILFFATVMQYITDVPGSLSGEGSVWETIANVFTSRTFPGELKRSGIFNTSSNKALLDAFSHLYANGRALLLALVSSVKELVPS
jgi:hypothetical protein